MTGEQLYDEWCNAGDLDQTADYRPWNHLQPWEHTRWEGLARIVYIV